MADTTELPSAVANLPAELDAVAKAVTAAGGVIKSVSDLLPDETRSVIVEIANLTGRSLTKTGDRFDHGAFDGALPEPVIGPFSSGVYAAVSDGVATGVEGWVTYTAEGAADFTVHFDDPFLGGNSQSVQSNTDDRLSILGDISTGNHAHARFAILDRTGPYPSVQPGWSSCPKCQSMHFAGLPNHGACPAGGSHDESGSFNYQILFNAAGAQHVQVDWGSCTKCRALYYTKAASRCAAGGPHDATGSFAYALTFGDPPTSGSQSGWQACRACSGLFYGPFHGTCPAGGPHDATGSFDYTVRFIA